LSNFGLSQPQVHFQLDPNSIQLPLALISPLLFNLPGQTALGSSVGKMAKLQHDTRSKFAKLSGNSGFDPVDAWWKPAASL
jgi:hypothetical protein